MTEPWPGWDTGLEDAGARMRALERAHDDYLSSGGHDSRLRPLVTQSWSRSLQHGLDPEHARPPVDLLDGDLDDWRNSHPLAAVMPVIRRILVDDAVDAGLLVAVSDAAGRLLWVEGPPSLRSRAEGIHFVEGAVWSEGAAGTNAPGTALAIDAPVQILAAEHLVRAVTPWSCSAAPIHDPHTGAILGALDLTGGPDVASRRTLSVVRATVAAVEGELRLRRLMAVLPGRGATVVTGEPLLRTLGCGTAILETDTGYHRLGLRHSEILALLLAHPDGLSGDQLAVELHDADRAAVTLRAELSRLRVVLGDLSLHARPYRLDARLADDATQVRRHLMAGDVGAAVALYRGPLLPQSDAPGVVRLRDELHHTLRRELLRTGDPDALLRFGDTEHGRYDWEIWHAASRHLSPSSPRRPGVETHLSFLDRELV